MMTFSINIGTSTEAANYNIMGATGIDLSSILDILPDNTDKEINPKDIRDAVLTSWSGSAFNQTVASQSNISYIGIDNGNTIFTDKDIKSKIYFGKRNFGTSSIRVIIYGNGIYLAGGYGGTIRSSVNGVGWTTQTSNFTSLVATLNYGNGLYIAAGTAGRLRTSTDAVTWITQTSNFGTFGISSIAYGNGIFVAGGYGGAIRSSTNAVTWTTQTSSFTTNISSITYGNGIFVAGGGNQIRSSTDAVTWITQTSNFATNIRALTYGNGIFVAGAFGGQLRTSEYLLNYPIPSITIPTGYTAWFKT
jgi:hypothetical protein